MNKKKVKEIKKILNVGSEDPVVRKKYNQIKKEYSSLNEKDKKKFLDNIRKLFDAGVDL